MSAMPTWLSGRVPGRGRIGKKPSGRANTAEALFFISSGMRSIVSTVVEPCGNDGLECGSATWSRPSFQSLLFYALHATGMATIDTVLTSRAIRLLHFPLYTYTRRGKLNN